MMFDSTEACPRLRRHRSASELRSEYGVTAQPDRVPSSRQEQQAADAGRQSDLELVSRDREVDHPLDLATLHRYPLLAVTPRSPLYRPVTAYDFNGGVDSLTNFICPIRIPGQIAAGQC